MARPPLPLGHHGEINVAPKNGHWVARCRPRGRDGVTRKVEKHGRVPSCSSRWEDPDAPRGTLDIYSHRLERSRWRRSTRRMP